MSLAHSSAGRVAYVAYTFPVLTQTFTVREVAALRERGVDVQVYAARRDPASALDELAEAEAERAEYLPGPLSIESLSAFLVYLSRSPLLLLRTLLSCLGGRYRDSGTSLRLRAPLHALLGVALARRLERDERFVRVHAQFVDAGSTVAYVASRLTGIAFSLMNHTAYNPFLLPLKVRHAERVLSISEFDRGLVLDACGPECGARVHVQRVGLDVGAWSDLPRRPQPGRLLVVGALREKKGHAVLLEALARVRDAGRTATLRVAGDGAEAERLRERAEELALSVEFLGAVGPAEVHEELTLAEAFVLPCVVAANGDLDGVPVAIMEAMAAGVPVVSTRLSGIPELVEHERSGLLAQPGDPEDLARQLVRLLDSEPLRERLAERGRARVAELHDLSRTSTTLARHLAGDTP